MTNNKNLPTISIVITSYNQGDFLGNTIKSVIGQNYNEKEIIIIDDGSSDNSLDIISEYESDVSIIVKGKNRGQGSAIHHGFEISSGEIIGWIASDDMLMPGALSRVARAYVNNKYSDALYYGGFEIIDTKGKTQEKYLSPLILSSIHKKIPPPICFPGTFFNNQSYKRAGGINPDMHYAFDLDLWMKFINMDIPFIRINSIQTKFRRHSHQKGYTRKWLNHCRNEEKAIRTKYNMFERYTLEYQLYLAIHRIINTFTGRNIFSLAYRIICRGRIKKYNVQYSSVLVAFFHWF